MRGTDTVCTAVRGSLTRWEPPISLELTAEAGCGPDNSVDTTAGTISAHIIALTTKSGEAEHGAFSVDALLAQLEAEGSAAAASAEAATDTLRRMVREQEQTAWQAVAGERDSALLTAAICLHAATEGWRARGRLADDHLAASLGDSNGIPGYVVGGAAAGVLDAVLAWPPVLTPPPAATRAPPEQRDAILALAKQLQLLQPEAAAVATRVLDEARHHSDSLHGLRAATADALRRVAPLAEEALSRQRGRTECERLLDEMGDMVGRIREAKKSMLQAKRVVEDLELEGIVSVCRFSVHSQQHRLAPASVATLAVSVAVPVSVTNGGRGI